MIRKRNFAHIPILNETKSEIDNLKNKLKEKYPDVTYEELVKILLEKNKNVIMSDLELRRLMNKSRGINI